MVNKGNRTETVADGVVEDMSEAVGGLKINENKSADDVSTENDSQRSAGAADATGSDRKTNADEEGSDVPSKVETDSTALSEEENAGAPAGFTWSSKELKTFWENAMPK